MYVQFKPQNNKALTKSIMDEAIVLLFGEIPSEVKKELRTYIKMHYEASGCVALYISDANRNSEETEHVPFMDLCKRLHIDPGKKEVIITPKALLYTHNYTYRPEIYHKW